MKAFHKSLAAVAAMLGLAAGQAACAQGAPDVATVQGGQLKGVAAGDVVSFKAIPYAAPPVGDLRWRPPAPPLGWSGVRDASAYGPACMQMGAMLGAAMAQSEDCLSLNVWTPVQHAGGKLPVMVWIHGGAFVAGAGGTPFYDGTAFAHDGVVMVSLNYRLGRLGFFTHPALDKESGPHGDFGFMDQIAALKWVKANIAAFGGDPDNVTIFGESAGAMSVNYLLEAPDARGLFQKAISESGFGRTDGRTLAAADALGEAFAKSQGVTGDDATAAKALRALPASAFNGALNGVTDPGIPGPIVDGTLIPQTMAQAFKDGHQAHVPYLTGGNSYEASLIPSTTQHPETVLDRLGPAKAGAVAMYGAGDPVKAAANITTFAMIEEPDRFLARQEAKVGVPAYVYYFSYLPAARRGQAIGVSHGGEIGYVFETLPKAPIQRGPITIPAATPDDEKIAAAVHAYWVAFAKTGSPNAAGGPAWPSVLQSPDAVMEFGDDGPVVRPDFEKARLDVIARQAEKPAP
jgi:para-nitrobenzyl esterase